MICPYCNSEIIHLVRDHIIPRAVWKWTNLYDIVGGYDSPENITFCCAECKQMKGSVIVNREAFLRYSMVNKMSAADFYDASKPELDKYMEIKQKAYDACDGKCFMCGNERSVEQMTLRRRTLMELRTADNAVVVCENCNDTFRVAREKI